MGYDANIVILKRKTLEDIKKVMPDYSFIDLYLDSLFTMISEHNSDFHGNEEARWIASPNRNIFNDFFGSEFKNNEVRMIDKETYNNFYKWIEEKLKSITLLDLANDACLDESYNDALIATYKGIRDNPVDFETEFVVFQHDW